MDLSIIIPVYNSGDVVGRLLDSIVQTETNARYEIIMINDGSTDHSQQVCQEYAEKYPYIKVLEQKNAGPSAARNRGLEEATGEYILFCDSDDYVSADMVNILFAYKNYDLVIFGLADEVWDENKLLSVKHHKPQGKVYESANSFLKDFAYLLENNLLYSQCTKMYKRSLIEKNHIRFREDLSMGEDISFNLEYFPCVENVCIIEEMLYHYVHLLSSKSISSNYYAGYYENVCMVLDKQKRVLAECDALTPGNLLSLESFFIGRVSSAIQNELINKQSSVFEKYRQLRKIVFSKEANEAVNKGTPKTSLYRCLTFGIKHRMVTFLFLLYEVVLIIKKRVVPLMAVWRKK